MSEIGGISNDSSVPDFIECSYNWTGSTMGETGLLSTDSVAVGYIACITAVLFYGSNFVPFKFVDAKDGFFAQWVMCVGVWFIGLIIHLARQQPVFFPWTLLGGAIWAFGNCCAVPVINLIGLSLGILIWNSVSVVVGWATGRFGLFGLCGYDPQSEAMNYVGVILCVLAGGIYTFIKSEATTNLPSCLASKIEEPGKSSKTLVAASENNADANPDSPMIAVDVPGSEPEKEVFLGRFPQIIRRIIGVSMALASGICYGIQFNFAIYIQQHTIVDGVRPSQNGLDYVFSQFCGILLGSTVFLIIYAIIRRRKAVVHRSLVLPGIMSGLMWGIATTGFFVANAALGQAIAFPIIMPGPGMVATFWGVCFFGEIKGWRNLLMLAVAASLTISGAIFTALSK